MYCLPRSRPAYLEKLGYEQLSRPLRSGYTEKGKERRLSLAEPQYYHSPTARSFLVVFRNS